MGTYTSNIALFKPAQGEAYLTLVNANCDILDALFPSTRTAGGVTFFDSSGNLAIDDAAIHWDAANDRLFIGTNTAPDVSTIRLLVKASTNVDSTSQPAGDWAAVIYHAENASGKNGLLIKNNWFASTSKLLEIGNDLLAGAYQSLWVFDGVGALYSANATGGSKGTGTINCDAAYDDNTLLTDFIADLYFDGVMREEDIKIHGQKQLLSIEETKAFMSLHRHLPSLPSREDWEKNGSKSLGEMVTMLWETVERLQLHIFELDGRLPV